MKKKTGTEIEEDVKRSEIATENDERHSKVQTSETSVEIQDSSIGRPDTDTGLGLYARGYNNAERRIGEVEKRTIDEVVEDKEFARLKLDIGNNIPDKLYKVLRKKYQNDNRITTEEYEFSEVIVYDLTQFQVSLHPRIYNQ